MGMQRGVSNSPMTVNYGKMCAYSFINETPATTANRPGAWHQELEVPSAPSV